MTEPEPTPEPRPSQEAPRFLDDPRNVTRIFHGLALVCGALVLVDLLHLYDKHGHYDFEHVPGFHAAFGFAAYVGLVTAAKGLRRLVKRGEDYYD